MYCEIPLSPYFSQKVKCIVNESHPRVSIDTCDDEALNIDTCGPSLPRVMLPNDCRCLPAPCPQLPSVLRVELQQIPKQINACSHLERNLRQPSIDGVKLNQPF